MSEPGDWSRGSEWRQWDLHVHTPASFEWHGQPFEANLDSPKNRDPMNKMVQTLNSTEPAAFALMDYWTFNGWLALQRHQNDPTTPRLTKTVFPGIELRLQAPMKARLNAHVIFSDKINEQHLLDFRSALQVGVIDQPLSDNALIELARRVGADKLAIHGFNKADVDNDNTKALRAGSTIAEIAPESYKMAISKVPHGHAIGFMPFDTTDGLAGVKWQDHYAYFLSLFQSSPIFESRDPDLRAAFVGEKTPANAKYFDNFQAGLRGIPRLVVSGSDAHRFVGTKGSNDNRGYGDFPSGKVTWIKADPTFEGLKQAILEPAKRSYIGERPPKLTAIATSKTYFIDFVQVQKTDQSATTGAWLDNVAVKLNPDLVAIIGNKGSGKSALADVIALLGNSRQKAYFSFLKKDRFRGKTGDPAKHFIATLGWLDGRTETRNLNEDPTNDKVELVKYIPQGHFEALCNDHVSGGSQAFENELRTVIFSHAGDAIRLGAQDFNQLVAQQEQGLRTQLNEFRKELHALNESIASCEGKLHPQVRLGLQDELALKTRQVEEHRKTEPTKITEPVEEQSPAQRSAAAELQTLATQMKLVDDESARIARAAVTLAAKARALQNVRERARLLERAHKQFLEDTTKDLLTLGIDASSLLTFSLADGTLDAMAETIAQEQTANKELATAKATAKDELAAQQGELQAELDAPQLLYQQYLKSHEAWQTHLDDLVGSSEAPDSLEGLQARIRHLEDLPTALEQLSAKRDRLAVEIFDTIDEQRKARAKLFSPVQDLIQSNDLIREEYQLQFRAELRFSFDALAPSLFSLIKQNAGEFRGDDESVATVRRLSERYDFASGDDALSFAKSLVGKIVSAANISDPGGFGIASLLRKDKQSTDVYDLIFGFTYLEPRYSLRFQDTPIEQLSPGQRGALLLIFYLLVDKGRNPILLDQPEENLDNETVVNLLVPVLTQAKKRRQVIMVTHNPNLAVVCDAEQIIRASFDRRSQSRITYSAGAIENPETNRRAVDVLEGTMPAFSNRRAKYH
jgi:ABC-type lipoprotein export system ATPase subunit